MKICPNYNSDYWKELVKEHGETQATVIWFYEELNNSSNFALDNSNRKSLLESLIQKGGNLKPVKGSVVTYKDKKWILWNITELGKAQLIDVDGNKFSGTPDLDKVKVTSNYPTTSFNGTDYIVTPNENIYSLATGAKVFTALDNGTVTQKERIIKQILEENGLEESQEPQEGLALVTPQPTPKPLTYQDKIDAFQRPLYAASLAFKKQNLFTVEPIQLADKKAKIKASIATQYIGFGDDIKNSSTDLYAKQAGDKANTGNYSSNDVIFVSVAGKRGNETVRKQQQDRTIKEATKALEAGATLITDDVNYIHYNTLTKQQRPNSLSLEEFSKENGLYNLGEKRLRLNLLNKKYIYNEVTIDGQKLGIWSKNNLSNYNLKDVTTETTNEEKRRHNVEVVNANGGFTGVFFDLEKQNDSIDLLFKYIFEAGIKNKEALSFDDLYVEVIDRVKNQIKQIVNANIKFKNNEQLTDLEKNYNSLMPFIQDWANIVRSQSQFKNFVERKFNNLKINVDNINESLLEDSDYGADESKHIFYTNEERNPKETMSERIKMFLSTIPKYEYDTYTRKVVLEVSSIGSSKLSNFEEIYEQLSFKFANISNLTFDKVIQMLLADQVKQPNLYTLGLRLNKSEDRIKNEFVTTLKKVNISPFITFFEKRTNSEGVVEYITKTIEANKNKINDKLISNWKQQQMFNGDVLARDSFGNISVSLIVVKALSNRFDAINQADAVVSDLEYKQLADDLLKFLGIKLSPKTLDELYNSKAFFDIRGESIVDSFNKDFNNQFKFATKKDGEVYPTGIFSSLMHILSGNSVYNDDKTQVSLNNPLYSDLRTVKFLATLDSKYTDETTSNYLNLEGKNIYSFILPSFETNQLIKIVNDEEYRSMLSKDLFGSNSYLFRILSDKAGNYQLGLFDGMKNKNSVNGITRDKSSIRENMMSEIYQYINEGSDNANYFDLAKSDKKTTLIHTGVPKIKQEQMHDEYFRIFYAEYVKIVNKDKLNKTKQIQQGADLFYFLPEFNYDLLKDILSSDELKMFYFDSNTINNNITLDDAGFRELFNKVIDNKVDTLQQDYSNKLVSENVPFLNTSLNSEELLKEFVFNKNIFNISIGMLISGDVTSFYKAKKNDTTIERINRTYDTYTKRLAKDIASGLQGNFNKSTYSALTITVPLTYAKEYQDLMLSKYYGTEEKGQIDSSDASQYCTVKRFFQILYSYGRVTKEVLNKAENLQEDEFLDEELLSFITAIKPVEVDRQSIEGLEYNGVKHNYSYIHYIKSSLIPLIPNHLQGLEIDNLRKLMEKNNIDQVNLDSAGKSGNPVVMLAPFDINNNWVYNGENLEQSTRIMNSDAFYIQQEIPFDEQKEKIVFITQLNKLIGDGLEMIDFSAFDYKGQKLSGSQMITEKENIRKEMMNFSFEELRDELGIDENGNIDIVKFRDYIVDNSDDLTESDLDNLEIVNGKFKIPLLFNNLKNQIESKLASHVRKAIQVKINGKSFVQASNLGFKYLDKSGNLPITGLIRTKGWKGDKLKPLRPVIKEINDEHGVEIYVTDEQLADHNKGKNIKLTDKQKEQIAELGIGNNNGILSIEILPAEVVVPFNFFSKTGNRIDIENFRDENGEVNISKELLKFVGARIPNQSHSSQLAMKIVGFTPAIGGDVVYVPAEITKQMGSDFDIDKLYVYKKKYSTYKQGLEVDELLKKGYAIRKQIDEFKRSGSMDESILEDLELQRKEVIKELKAIPDNRISDDITLSPYGKANPKYKRNIEDTKNDYFDILYNVLINTTMFNKVMQPLDMNDLKEVVSSKENLKSKVNDLFSPIRQVQIYTSNTGVKKLVGTFSLALTFNTLLQRTSGIHLRNAFRIGGNGKDIKPMQLDSLSGLGRSNFKFKDENGVITDVNRTTSDNVIMVQSEAVDNANNQVIDKINLGDETAFAYLALLSLKDKAKANKLNEISSLGNEYASQLINNSVVREYVKFYKQNVDMFNTAQGKDAKVIALKEMGIANYTYYDLIGKDFELTDEDLGIVRNEDGVITEFKDVPSDNQTKSKIISVFLRLDALGTEIFKVMNLTNADTKGFGNNIIEGTIKRDKINNLGQKESNITNVTELFNDTELGTTNDLAFDVLNNVSKLFNYDILDNIVASIEKNTGKDLSAKEIRKLSLNYTSYVYSSNIFWDNSESEIRRLLFNSNTTNPKYSTRFSLAIRLNQLKEKYPNYLLFSRIKSVISEKGNEPDYITYNALDYDKEKDRLADEFFTLLNSNDDELVDFVKDLIRYNYITGGASNFNSIHKLIPSVIINKQLSNHLQTIISEKSNKNTDLDNVNFIRQYYQHNPISTKPISKGVIIENEVTNDQSVDDLVNFNSGTFDNLDNVPDFFHTKYVKTTRDNEGNTTDEDVTALYELLNKTEIFNRDKGEYTYSYVYLRIDTLGDKFINEYKFGSDSNNSLIKKNKTEHGIHTKDLVDKRFADFKVIKKAKKEDLGFINFKSLYDTLLNLESKMLSNSEDISDDVRSNLEGKVGLINIISKALINNNLDVKVTSSPFNLFNGKEIKLDLSSDKVVKNLLHESIHAVTVDFISKNPNDPSVIRLNELRKQVITTLTKQEQDFVNSFSEINKSKKEDDKKARYDALTQELFDNNFTNDRIALLYSLSDAFEFVTGVMTDNYVQSTLDSINSIDKNKSLFEKFKDIINSIMAKLALSVGINITNSEGVLFSALSEVVNIIQRDNVKRDNDVLANNINTSFFSVNSASNNPQTNSIQDIMSKLLEIRDDIYSEQEDPKFNFIKNLRINQLYKDYLVLQKTTNYLDSLLLIGEKHYDYIDNLITDYLEEQEEDKITHHSSDEVLNAVALYDLWISIKDSIPNDYIEDDRLVLLVGKFGNLDEKFKNLRIQGFIDSSKLNTQVTNADVTTGIIETNIINQYTLASSRSQNLAIQTINKSLNIAKINTLRANKVLQDKLSELGRIVKDNNLDLGKLMEFSNDDTASYIRLIVPYSDTRIKSYKERTQLSQVNNYEDTVVNFDVNELFELDANGHMSLIEGKVSSTLDVMANKIKHPNKKLVLKVLNDLLIKQKELITKYEDNLEVKKGELADSDSTGVTQDIFDYWVKDNNPFLFKRSATVTKTYLLDVKKEKWDSKYDDIFNDEKLLNVYDNVSQIMSELISLIPANLRKKNDINGNYLPIISSAMIKDSLTAFGELKKLCELPNFSAPDIFEKYDKIPLKFVDKKETDAILARGVQSNQLLQIMSIFGESVHHHYYFNQIKANVLLGQQLLKEATPYNRDYKGNKQYEGGEELLHKAGEGLEKELELLDNTIRFEMYLEQTKPEVALLNKFNTKLEDLDDLIIANEKNISSFNPLTAYYTLDELNKEKELLIGIRDRMAKDKGIFDKLSSIKDKAKAKYTGESYETVENLYNFYMAKLDKISEQRVKGEINFVTFKAINEDIQSKLKSLNRSTIYASRIVDWAIKQRRSISLNLNPFSATRNYIGGILNGIVNGGIEYDNKNFFKNILAVSNLMTFKKNSEEAFKMYKIAKNLLVLENLVDLQGMSERQWFDKYGFILMEKSEQAVRLALMKSILEKDGLYDSFDKDGNINLDTDTLNNLILKIQRTNDIIMGDTHSYKMINKSYWGRALGQFKSSWLPEAIANRFEDEKFDDKLNRNVKGRYRTLGDLGILGSLIGVVKVYESWITGNKDYKNIRNSKTNEKISELDAVNLARNTVELTMILSLMALGVMLKSLADDDDDNKAVLVFITNQMLLIQRDLTSASPTVISDILAGNAVPALSVFTNIGGLVPASIKLISDDEYDFSKFMYKLNKVIPVLNIISQYEYQSKHFVEDLN